MEFLPVAVDKSHLITIGERLYSESIELIRELVNNAYDADATDVWVTVSEEAILVEDNGTGMDLEGVRQYKNCQYMTPETRRSSHFFWDYLRNYKRDDPNVSLSLRDSMMDGFMEDKIFIERQQEYLELNTPFQPRGLVADKAFAHFRKVWNKKIAEEKDKYPPQPVAIRNPIL